MKRIFIALAFLLGSVGLVQAETLKRDGNGATVCGGVSTADATIPLNARVDPAKKGLVTGGRPGTAFVCTLAPTTSTTILQITGCEVLAGKSYFITDIIVGGDAANPATTSWLISSGTSTACTGGRVVMRGFHPANGTNVIPLITPFKVTQGDGLCLTDGTTGTKAVTLLGYTD